MSPAENEGRAGRILEISKGPVGGLKVLVSCLRVYGVYEISRYRSIGKKGYISLWILPQEITLFSYIAYPYSK
jgi:hypothetical protein